MSGILWVVLGMAIGLLTRFLFLRWRLDAAAPPRSRTSPPTRAQAPARTRAQAEGQAAPFGGVKRKLALKFHGVSLKPGLDPCAGVEGLVGQRFLPAEAPALPLPGCDRKKCQCAYSHHGDRRDAADRRSGWGAFDGSTPTEQGGNRRGKGRERRARR